MKRLFVIRSIKLVATCHWEYKVSVKVGVNMFKRIKGKKLLFYLYIFKNFEFEKEKWRILFYFIL